jgi:hypothetical protein
MWQKLNQLDIVKLERARIQLTNIIQLVSAAPVSYNPEVENVRMGWLKWDKETSSLRSEYFGENAEIYLTLDIERFILSIIGPNNQKEHLVLSGMTYPMAYGWLKIKLGMFGLDGDLLNDNTTYVLEHYLKPGEEIDANDERIYENMPIYYSNAYFLLDQLRATVDNKARILVDPSTSNLVLLATTTHISGLGFSFGTRPFPEPYFYVQFADRFSDEMLELKDFEGLWDSKNNKMVLMASDFLTHNHDLEYQRVMDFFTTNLMKLAHN